MYQLLTDKKQHWVTQNLGVDLPEQPYPAEAYPGYAAPIVLLDDQSNVKCTLARFGLVPHWAKDANIGRRTYNASGALLTVRSGKSACSHDLVTVSCGSGRSDCLNWRQS